MSKTYGSNLASLPEGHFDSPLGESSGAADIFGTTGGVMEAALRMAVEAITGAPPSAMEFTEVRAVEGLRERELKVNDELTLSVGVANGLTNAKILLDEVLAGEKKFHIIEIMACPGGCIGGGGQPLHRGDSIVLKARMQAIYKEDLNKVIRKSHENPEIARLYEEFLGKPLSEMSHKLLHTHYFSHPKK